MSKQQQEIVELLKTLGGIGFQARRFESDEHGNLLIDPTNEDDVEWHENNAAYDIIQNEFSTDD